MIAGVGSLSSRGGSMRGIGADDRGIEMNDSNPQPEGHASVPDTWRPEPELAGDLPRRVAAEFRVRLTRRFLATVTLLLPAVLISLGYPSQRRLSALRARGAVAVGTVVERTEPQSHARGGTSPAKLVHEFRVAGTAYRITETLRPTKWHAFGYQNAVPIRYLPESPEVAQTEREMQDE
jgi:hypothetical protein